MERTYKYTTERKNQQNNKMICITIVDVFLVLYYGYRVGTYIHVVFKISFTTTVNVKLLHMMSASLHPTTFLPKLSFIHHHSLRRIQIVKKTQNTTPTRQWHKMLIVEQNTMQIHAHI